MSAPALRVHPEVADALAMGRPVVALESTIISHGLPRPDNLRVAREVEATVRARGAVPATIAIVGGAVRIGLDAAALELVATGNDVVKASARDLAPALAAGRHAATTVAATAHLAALAGIRLFATGGLGGVHRGAADTFDESADLTALARTAITVVCSGVKSVLDVAATLERLETLGVSVLGYGTTAFPGFYLTDSGERLDWQVDSPAAVAAVIRARAELRLEGSALVLALPLPPEEQLDPELHDRVLAEGLAALRAGGVTGKDVTPFLLEHLHRRTGGASLAANIRLVQRNAALAADVAVALA